MFKGYLSGPIDNCTSAEIKDWRNFLKKEYPQYHWYDPLDLTDNAKESVIEKDFSKIIPKEKQMIVNSDFMIVYPWKPSSGTSMEVMFAYDHKIPVIAIKDPNQLYLSPWITYHCIHVANTFKDAMEALDQFLELKMVGRLKVSHN